MTPALDFMERVRLLQVSVVDDRREEAEDIQAILRLGRIDARVVVPTRDQSMDDLVTYLKSTSNAVLCDHRLSEYSGVNYTGAQLASSLNRDHVPAVLFSSYTDPEHSPEIRAELASLPSYLPRGELNRVDKVAAALDSACSEVLLGQPPLERQKFRTVVRILGLEGAPSALTAVVIIPAFHPDKRVRVPLRMLEDEAPGRPSVLVGRRYMALVNICAESEHEVFLEDARPAIEIPEG